MGLIQSPESKCQPSVLHTQLAAQISSPHAKTSKRVPRRGALLWLEPNPKWMGKILLGVDGKVVTVYECWVPNGRTSSAKWWFYLVEPTLRFHSLQETLFLKPSLIIRYRKQVFFFWDFDRKDLDVMCQELCILQLDESDAQIRIFCFGWPWTLPNPLIFSKLANHKKKQTCYK